MHIALGDRVPADIRLIEVGAVRVLLAPGGGGGGGGPCRHQADKRWVWCRVGVVWLAPGGQSIRLAVRVLLAPGGGGGGPCMQASG